VTLATARQKAREVVAAAKGGLDLVAERGRLEAERLKAAASARTVRELVAEYVERHCKPHLRGWRQVEQRLHNHVLPVLGDKAAGDVRRGDILALMDDLQHKKGFRQQVNRVRSALASMFRYAVEREYVAESPVMGTRARKVEIERQRILSDQEIRAIWLALDDLPDPGRSFVKTLFLTATRREEVRAMQWAEIAPASDLWLLPGARNKANRDFEIPLARQMVALLAGLPKLGAHVFTLSGAAPWGAVQLFKQALDNKSGVTAWVLHDIRRTVRSKLAELSVSHEIAERVLNHAMTKIERTYNRHSYRQEKAQALQRWADHLMGLVYADSEKVVPLKRLME
jgi:integrase